MLTLTDYFVKTAIELNSMLPAAGLNVLPFLILLGVVVIFHELGHFLVAKLFGVRVEEFSIGFPPKLIGKKFGETEYIISLLPIGGYVKLAGQDDFGKVSINKEDKGMYYSKPAWQRFLIVFMGPFTNFIIGWALFTGLYVSGMPVEYNPEHPGKIGMVFEKSPSAEAGIQPGDEILFVGDKKIQSWTDLLELSINPQSETYKVKIKRGEQTFEKNITPQKSGNRYLFGISQFQSPEIGSIILNDDPDIKNNPVSKLRAGDVINSINGRKIFQWESIEEMNFFNPAKRLVYNVSRNGTEFEIELIPKSNKLENAGFIDLTFVKDYDSKLYATANIIEKVNDPELEKNDIKQGDKIFQAVLLEETKTVIDGVEMTDYSEINEFKISSGYEFIKVALAYPNKQFKIKIERNGEIVERLIKSKTKNFEIGTLNFFPKEYVEKLGFSAAFTKSLYKTKDFIIQTFQVVGKIISRKMEAKTALGGPITMWKMTVITAEAGYSHFLMLMAIISINLGFINLLPIPVIDGGHIVFYIYEMISGKMPSEKVMNLVQQAGLAIIIFLMLFTFYIDIAKMF
ncbi:MAG TPA: RIP metalloprotease RseP [bacterium]|nr:RIP metalloprotease RseP [bacterium]